MTCELRFVAATLNVGGGLEFESRGSLAIKTLIHGVWYNIELEMMVQYKKSDKITLNLKEFGKKYSVRMCIFTCMYIVFIVVCNHIGILTNQSASLALQNRCLEKSALKKCSVTCRLKITSILSNFFRSVIVLSPNDLLPCVYLCLNKVSCL